MIGYNILEIEKEETTAVGTSLHRNFYEKKKIRETTKILKYEVGTHTKNKNHIHNTQCSQ